MNIDVVSDLHLEFNDDKVKTEDLFKIDGPRSDTLIIAGDICPINIDTDKLKNKTKEYFDMAKSLYKNIIYVLGNHDYWGGFIELSHDNWERLIGIRPLENSEVVIDDTVFVGCTLWTNVKSVYSKRKAMNYMNDFRYIYTLANVSSNKYYEYRIDCDDLNKINQKNRKYITSVAKKYPDKKIVVVTHHAPLYACAGNYNGDMIDSYCNNASRLISNNENIVAWIHGHNHDSKTFIYKPKDREIQIIANPRGYYNKYTYDENWKIKTFEV